MNVIDPFKSIPWWGGLEALLQLYDDPEMFCALLYWYYEPPIHHPPPLWLLDQVQREAVRVWGPDSRVACVLHLWVRSIQDPPDTGSLVQLVPCIRRIRFQ